MRSMLCYRQNDSVLARVLDTRFFADYAYGASIIDAFGFFKLKPVYESERFS